MLTDEEIRAIDPDGLAEGFARAIESAVLAKLREQNEPVAWTDETGYVWPNDDKHIKSNNPLYKHPAPIPEGWQLVPIDPEGQWSNNDLINIMVDAFNDAEGGKYDSMLAAYKAMLAAARSGE